MKQFKNLILAGALVLGLAGFAVSCDKYGDDIDNLQTQIDNQNKSLSDKLAAVESSIASLQSAQSNLESAIAAARDAAEKAALEAQEQAIETAKAELATAKAELQAAIAANQAAIEANAAGIEANAGEIAGVKAAVEGVEEEISGLQAAQDSLKSEIAATNDAAKKAILEAKNEAIEAAKAELTTVKAALEAAIQDNVDAIKAVNEAVNAIKATVEEKTSEIVGRIEALETFRTTTEAALDELAKAKETLTESVGKLNTEVVELGKRLTAVEAQVTALEKYKETNDEAVGANKAAIDILIAQLATVQGKLSQLDGIKTQIAALEQYKNDNDAAVNAIKQKQEELESDLNGLDSKLSGLSDQISEINDDLDILYAALASGVTSVELVYSYSKQQVDHPYNPDINHDDANGSDNEYQDHYYDGTNLTFGSTAEKDNVFGEGVVSNPLTFEAGNQYFVPQAFTVRVSPTNAVLTPEMITLVNSKGESLDFIEVVKVEKFNALLTRAAGGSGLWTVTVRLASYDKETFDAATKVKQGNEEKAVLFAVKVNNTAKYEGLKTRDVVSTYDLTVNYEAYEPEDDLKYYVDDTPIAKVNNRYEPDSKSLQQTVTANDLAPEYTWQNEPAVAPVTKGANVNVRLDGPATPPTGDNRSDEAVYPAVQGTPITISLHDKNGNPYTGIRAFYVVLDEQNAVESRPSELNAWKSYTYDGLGVVVEGTETTITIDSETAINDIIGFRVYAVNYDGTLVDPDGKAFYVQLGTESEDWNAAATTIVPKGNKDNRAIPNPYKVEETHSDSVSVTTTKLTGADHFEWVTDEIAGNTKIFHAYFVDENGNDIFDTKSGIVANVKDFSKIAKVYTVPALTNWTNYEDNKAYTGTLTVYSKSNHVLATITVTFTKKLPTAAPAAFSVKDKQLANETTWNAYLIPIENEFDDPDAAPMWTNAKAQFGAMKLDNLFNFGDNDAEHYTITFAEAQPDAKDPTKDGDNKVNNTKLVVKAKYIDNETSHETTVVYNYGKISSKQPTVDYTVTATSFQTVFHEIYDKDTYTWRWAKKGDKPLSESGDGLAQKDEPKTTVEYGTGDGEVTFDKFELVLAKAIFGESTHDKLYNAFIDPSYKGSVKVVSAKLTSDKTGTEDYFTIDVSSGTKLVFTPISGATNPNENVPSTLTITYTDQYAVARDLDAVNVHTHTFTLKMTVKKR